MAKVSVYNNEGNVIGEIELSDAVFGAEINENLMHKATGLFYVHLKDVDFWWPRGYGEPALYDVCVQLRDRNTGEVYDSDVRRIGIRKVALELDDINLPDKPGQFRFVVNGVPVFARGTNWVPMDALHSRDRDHYDSAVGLMVEMNCNIVRCWGGNVYEDHRFFERHNGMAGFRDGLRQLPAAGRLRRDDREGGHKRGPQAPQPSFSGAVER